MTDRQTIAHQTVCFFSFVVACSAPVVRADIAIVAPKSAEADAGWILAMNELADALKRTDDAVLLRFGAPSAPTADTDLIVVGPRNTAGSEAWRPLVDEGFRIRPIATRAHRSLAVEGDARGVMYGLFKLAEVIRLGQDPWKLHLAEAPAFPIRMFSEQGQLLDLPDIAYYSDKPPYVNEQQLRAEIDEAKRLIEHVVRLGFNTITLLHVSCEEYIDYRYLGKRIYGEDDRHRARSPVFCRYLTELCDYAHARHVDVFLQFYEFQYPPKIQASYNLALDGPHIERIINAKMRELFERVPLDGLVITPTEAHPRCGYVARRLWEGKGRAGAGRMMTLYHDACRQLQKRVVFRIWRVATDAPGAREVLRHAPPDAMISVKNTGGDFYLSSGTTDVITRGVGLNHPLMVVFDTFRQFEGWSQLFCYMKRYGNTVQLCRRNGVKAINAWGSWQSGCIWPDWSPGYMTDGDGTRQTGSPVSWVGQFNHYRMFTRGFTPGQANVYLLARLAWNPDASPQAVARDFAALHVGCDNAEAAARALMLTQDAFSEYYLGAGDQITHPAYLKWATSFALRPELAEKGYRNLPFDKLLQSNRRALRAVREFEDAFARTCRNQAPDGALYDRFREGVEKTSLYLRTLYEFREYWWRRRRDADLNGKEQNDNRLALKHLRARLNTLFVEWKRFPQEAGYWRITFRYGMPDVERRGVFPNWYPRGEATTMDGTVRLP
jgi:hypothetical protein